MSLEMRHPTIDIPMSIALLHSTLVTLSYSHILHLAITSIWSNSKIIEAACALIINYLSFQFA